MSISILFLSYYYNIIKTKRTGASLILEMYWKENNGLGVETISLKSTQLTTWSSQLGCGFDIISITIYINARSWNPSTNRIPTYCGN
jgi:hypothetical protein